MKKFGMLNSCLSKVVDDLGHTDTVCIGDLGLPVPPGVTRVDLALKRGEPTFQDVLAVYLDNVVVEKVYLADEIRSRNPRQHQAILAMLSEDVEVVYVTHVELKRMSVRSRAVVRTGEDTPFSNIILESGVTI